MRSLPGSATGSSSAYAPGSAWSRRGCWHPPLRHQPETVIGVGSLWIVQQPKPALALLHTVVSAAQYPVCAHRRAPWVAIRRVNVVVLGVPVLHPFGDITRHVEQAIRVRSEAPDGGCGQHAQGGAPLP